jgi:hypothetical protein
MIGCSCCEDRCGESSQPCECTADYCANCLWCENHCVCWGKDIDRFAVRRSAGVPERLDPVAADRHHRLGQGQLLEVERQPEGSGVAKRLLAQQQEEEADAHPGDGVHSHSGSLGGYSAGACLIPAAHHRPRLSNSARASLTNRGEVCAETGERFVRPAIRSAQR